MADPTSECTSDADCPAGYVCEFGYPATDPANASDALVAWGLCVPAQPTECVDDTQCPAGYTCQTESICPDCVYADPPCMMPCMLSGVCVANTVPSECNVDADCGAGYYCEFMCPPCLPGYECPACVGQCVANTGGQCTADSQCGVGYKCEVQTVCYDMPCIDPTDPNVPCGGGCFEEGWCVPVQTCEGIACAPGEVLDPATCTCYVPETNPCVVSGCSGEICAAEPMASPCIWEEWYVCLQAPYTSCGPFGPNGECMWQSTVELTNCLSHYNM